MGIFSRFLDSGGDPVAYFLLLSSAVRVVFWWVNGGQKPPERRTVGRVSRLSLYPVKSMAGIEVDQLECAVPGAYIGPIGDRHFLVTRGDQHEFVTARTEQYLFFIQPEITSSGELKLVADDMEPLVISLKDVEAANKVVHSMVHGSAVVGLDCGEKVGEWLSKFLKKPGYHLIYSSPSVEKRTIRNGVVKYADWTAHVDITDKMAYHDSSTYNIISESSVNDLNSRIAERSNLVTTEHFRANVVVSGASAYDEDNWTKVYIGDVEFSPIKLCGRCYMTTVDPKSAKASVEPLKTLRKYRKLVPSFGDAPCLGVNLILDKPGTIRVGDTIEALIGRPRLAP